jgi:uncharacterized protein
MMPLSRDADYWISHLKLSKHIEGGYYRETYRSSLTFPSIAPGVAAGDTINGTRSASTSIYFLLKNGQFSAFHRIKSDEVWHFYDGDALDIFEIIRDGTLITHKLGRNPGKGESLQVVIKTHNWFGSRVCENGAFALVGCTVAPGFDFADFELADREALTASYPSHNTLIKEMTYT